MTVSVQNVFVDIIHFLPPAFIVRWERNVFTGISLSVHRSEVPQSLVPACGPRSFPGGIPGFGPRSFPGYPRLWSQVLSRGDTLAWTGHDREVPWGTTYLHNSATSDTVILLRQHLVPSLYCSGNQITFGSYLANRNQR